ncbi:ABC transporter ATP-binding protein/permease [Enterococcus sp. 669A]|uniref:ABC transporter ATP-binding protein/permease n=1 Tax=Candidatus Enterococcus moelleringii TaxID=2815325 RepID=A0ABS3LBL0_9ENTE|nr:ABC transporter ATP-binding protein/permease [Enterococcus sp. 669A]MBO1306408.1 ABC transporter ATP-binding protein/permease [Enterococcus sp. 669A]
MIDRRLFQVTDKKILLLQVLLRCGSLVLSIFIWKSIAHFLSNSVLDTYPPLSPFLVPILLALVGKLLLIWILAGLSDQASANLRISLRQKVMEKAFRLGNTRKQLSATALTQLSGDGIEQLETYYARFLPQLFYCLFASVVLFINLFMLAHLPAIVMLICVPFIPLVIMLVMKIAKRILSKYWSNYTNLGTKFHESLAALSVLKAYNQDEQKQHELAADANRFRKATMSLLGMQLNSITIMDILSYSGAALGIGLALFAFQAQQLSLYGMLVFILLSAEFFLPMRQLGSLFHVAMNGISSCEKIFDYLDLPERSFGSQQLTEPLTEVKIDNLSFSYSGEIPALTNLSARFSRGCFTAFVGKSGSGKSTFAQLLLNQLDEFQGDIWWNQFALSDLSRGAILERAVLVNTKDFLYLGSLKDNLLLANPDASDEELWAVLKKVKLETFVADSSEKLAMPIEENGHNLSGGQRQRLILARALLKDADLYIFDEITSGVDLESEEIILAALKKLAQEKIVIFVSHRMYNVLQADQVYVFKDGKIIESGAPEGLRKTSDYFKAYFLEENQTMKGELS